MKDKYARTIDYLRISVTDRCNLSCCYCSPGTAFEQFDRKEILTFEEIVTVCEEASHLGIRKVRITGGEPLVRKDVAKLIRMIKDISKIEEVNITTNGVLLKEHLETLIDAGIDGINVSLDVANREQYQVITGVDAYDKVCESIVAAMSAGVRVKLNTVLLDGEAYKTMFVWAKDYPIDVRFIELMPLGVAKGLRGISYNQVLAYMEQSFGAYVPDHEIRGNGPAQYYKLPGFQGAIGLISPMHNRFCANCNKIRLTAIGALKPCLCFEQSLDLKTPLREHNRSEVRRILEKGMQEKPESHFFEDITKVTEAKRMISIGG